MRVQKYKKNMELARSPTIFIQKYISFLLSTRARAYLKKYICVKSFFFSKNKQNIWSYQKKAVPLQPILVFGKSKLPKKIFQLISGRMGEWLKPTVC